MTAKRRRERTIPVSCAEANSPLQMTKNPIPTTCAASSAPRILISRMTSSRMRPAFPRAAKRVGRTCLTAMTTIISQTMCPISAHADCAPTTVQMGSHRVGEKVCLSRAGKILRPPVLCNPSARRRRRKNPNLSLKSPNMYGKNTCGRPSTCWPIIPKTTTPISVR